MSRQWFGTIFLIGAFTLAMPLLANQGNGKGKGNPHKEQSFDRNDGDDGDHDGNDRWERRGDYEYRVYGEHEGVPPGWNKGRKTGWGNCGMPPGQAKKYGCRNYQYEGRDYSYYHDERGRIVVRRPSIHIHGGIDIH